MQHPFRIPFALTAAAGLLLSCRRTPHAPLAAGATDGPPPTAYTSARAQQDDPETKPLASDDLTSVIATGIAGGIGGLPSIDSSFVPANGLRDRIRAVLPPRWRAGADGHRVWVSRDVLRFPDQNNLGPQDDNTAKHGTYTLALALGSTMPPSGQVNFARVQRIRHAELYALESRMTMLEGNGLEHAYNPDYYEPKTAADRALVQRRRVVKRLLPPVPQHYVDAYLPVVISDDGCPEHSAACYSPMRCEDCTEVRAAVTNLLNAYPESPTEPKLKR